MKNIVLFLLLSHFALGQVILQDAPMQCGTVEPPNTIIISKAQASQIAADNTIRTIPLVFHIVWNPTLYPQDSAFISGRIASYQNIAQKFFRKQNADTSQTVPAFRSVMADAHIEFCLKQVIFKRTTEVSFTTNDKIKFLPTGSPAVDPLKHCNIWLGRLSGSLGGYAYFPSVSSVGHPFDGVVTVLAPTISDEQIAEIIVHEILHYLGVYHPWGSSCTGDGDFCNDTPPTDAPSGCQLSTVHCGVQTMVQNVMDYAHCATGLTGDQAARTAVTLIGQRNALWNSGTCSGNPGNTPPTVSITLPANGQQFPTAPATVTINATAADANGTVTQVEFYQGTTLLSSDVSAPYSFAWTNVTAGSYTLTAKATDNGGANTTSAVINITVGTSTAPVCNLISPVNGATFIYQVQSVKIEATATDADGIAKVEVAVNNNWINIQLPGPTYVIYWQPYSIGTHTIKARATDNTGAVTISQTSTITVTGQTNPPPTVSITSPTNGATYNAPASITINANATDNTSISKVEFYQGTLKLSTDNTLPYSFTWNSVVAGNYTLAARAYDSQNASSVSSPVNVVVSTGGIQDSPAKTITLLKDGKLKVVAEDLREKIIP